MKERFKNKLKEDKDAILDDTTRRLEKSWSWAGENRGRLTGLFLITGTGMLLLNEVLRFLEVHALWLFTSLDSAKRTLYLGEIESAAWNLTVVGTLLLIVFYVLPFIRWVLRPFLRPVRFILLIVIVMVFSVLDLFGVGRSAFRWLKRYLPGLRKMRPDEEKDMKSLEELKQERMKKQQDKQKMRIPETVKLIPEGPSYTFVRDQKSSVQKQRLGEAIKERFLGVCARYQLEFVVVEKVIKGPSATILSCSLGDRSISELTKREADITRSMEVDWIRIDNARGVVNVIVPCAEAEREYVHFEDVISEFRLKGTAPLEIPFGRTSTGDLLTFNIAKGPHFILFGATGSGKSTASQEIMASLLMRSTPDQVRFLLIDTKLVELTRYNGIPHLMMPVITKAEKAIKPLERIDEIVRERYAMFGQMGIRDIEAYNRKAKEPLPYIVVMIEELADIMANKSTCDAFENLLQLIVQFARAAGIHLICATQRPSVDVITGLIKANIPARIAFQVSSQTDSRVGMDDVGADKLMGEGDGLLKLSGAGKPVNFQCAYIDDAGIDQIVNHWKAYKRKESAHERREEMDMAYKEDVKPPEKAPVQDMDKIPSGIFKAVRQARTDAEEVHVEVENVFEDIAKESITDSEPEKEHAADCTVNEPQKELHVEEFEGEQENLEQEDDLEQERDHAIKHETVVEDDFVTQGSFEEPEEADYSQVIETYEAFDENTLRVGIFVAAIRYLNRYTEVAVLPSVLNMNESLKMRKDTVLEAINVMDTCGIVKKSEMRGRGATTQILLSNDEAISVLKIFRPDILGD